jgi:transcriptional regulator with XRE-family HTH domain
VPRKQTLRQKAADTPLARWLVDLAESRGWTSGRQAALYLGVNHATLWTWLHGTLEPDLDSQAHLHEVTGESAERIAELVRATQAAKRTPAARYRTSGRRATASLTVMNTPVDDTARLGVEVAYALARGEQTEEEEAYMRRFVAEVTRRRASLEGRDEPTGSDPPGAGYPA